MAQELKAYIAPTPDGTGLADYYLKSEADKVIAEKDDEIVGLKVKLKVQTSNAEKAWKLKDSYHTNYAEAVKELYDKNKVIAELEESHKNEVKQLLILNSEQANAANRLRDSMEQVIFHQKYKRCLAMAEWCDATALWCYQAANTLPAGFHATLYGKPVMIEPNRLFKRYVLLTKWSARWSELAEKFKEAK